MLQQISLLLAQLLKCLEFAGQLTKQFQCCDLPAIMSDIGARISKVFAYGHFSLSACGYTIEENDARLGALGNDGDDDDLTCKYK